MTTDGNAGGGFEAAIPAGKNNVKPEQYAAAPAAAFPAKDMSSQGPAGTTNKMVHTAAETSAFGTGK
jgi:hypothetical protein